MDDRRAEALRRLIDRELEEMDREAASVAAFRQIVSMEPEPSVPTRSAEQEAEHG